MKIRIEAETHLKLAWPAIISEIESETLDHQMFNTIEVRMNREKTIEVIEEFKKIIERLENVVRIMQQ